MIKKLVRSRIFIAAVILLSVLTVRHITNRYRAVYMPDYGFSEVKATDSYDRIFKYTGLSPAAIDKLRETGNFETVLELNKLYFEKNKPKRSYIAFPVTVEEKNSGKRIPLAPLKDGDILVTFNTHTLDWRHGHLAIVTDAENGIILEHLAIGQTSSYGYAPYWGNYPSFAVLRYPDENIAKKAAQYARDNLVDVPYSILAGLVNKDKSDDEKIDSSHCSHIVWQAFRAAGTDLDSNKGQIVTPKDVATSPKLELVQIFGMNSKEFEYKLAK